MSTKPRTNLFLDTAIFSTFCVVVLSGLLSHTSVGHGRLTEQLLSFGFNGHFLNDLHVIMAVVMVALVGVHLIVHSKWISAQLNSLRQQRSKPA
jgi:hypothetical protein